MSTHVPITVAMEAPLHIIQEAGARIDLETIKTGEKVYLRGARPDGISETLRTYNGTLGYALSQGQ
jgi:hypothetical protein